MAQFSIDIPAGKGARVKAWIEAINDGGTIRSVALS